MGISGSADSGFPSSSQVTQNTSRRHKTHLYRLNNVSAKISNIVGFVAKRGASVSLSMGVSHTPVL